MPLLAAFVVASICVLTLGRLALGKESLPAPGNRDKGKEQEHLAALSVPIDQPPSVDDVPRPVGEAVEALLRPLAWADASLLPPRLDMSLRRQLEHQIAVLRQAGLRRIYRFTEVTWGGDLPIQTDQTREWREARFEAVALEQLVDWNGNVVQEIHHPSVTTTIRQSRRIQREAPHHQSGAMTGGHQYPLDAPRCPNCGHQLDPAAGAGTCSFCGAPVAPTLPDWQTESFEIVPRTSAPTPSPLRLVLLFVLILLTGTTYLTSTSNLAQALVAFLVVTGIMAGVFYMVDVARPKRMTDRSESFETSHMRARINEALWQDERDLDPARGLLSFHVGTPSFRGLEETNQWSERTMRVMITRVSLSPNRTIEATTLPRMVQAVRLRGARMSTMSLVPGAACPSCGAAFVPDAQDACLRCGFSPKEAGADWQIMLHGVRLGPQFH